MNLIQDDETLLVLPEIEFRIGQFRPVRRQFQIEVNGAGFELRGQRKGQGGFADLTRSEKPNRWKSGQEVLDNGFECSLDHYLAIMPCHSMIARFAYMGYLGPPATQHNGNSTEPTILDILVYNYYIQKSGKKFRIPRPVSRRFGVNDPQKPRLEAHARLRSCAAAQKRLRGLSSDRGRLVVSRASTFVEGRLAGNGDGPFG